MSQVRKTSSSSGNQIWQKDEKMQYRSWDKEEKKATGCDYIEWINGTTEKLDEKCPKCREPLVCTPPPLVKR